VLGIATRGHDLAVSREVFIRVRGSRKGRGARKRGSTIGGRLGRCHYRAGLFRVRVVIEREELD
jgi:hypothetical protein